MVRAHRLWETYLDRTGTTPKEEIHDTAHRLEHLSDEKTVEYLDDKLGHPVTDPHGSIIPNDSELIVGKDLLLSVLRDGNRATVVKTDAIAAPADLKVGERITMGPRSDDGEIWAVITSDGKTLRLTHDQVDAVVVRLLPRS